MTRLLDVNVLIALAWPNHVHHGPALEWFVEVRDGGWATCPTTESGFVRVSSNARLLPDARTPGEALALLRRMRAGGAHRFWSDDVSPVDDRYGLFARVVGHRQVTDAHLLSIALAHDGILATFDRGAAELAGPHADHVELIAA